MFAMVYNGDSKKIITTIVKDTDLQIVPNSISYTNSHNSHHVSRVWILKNVNVPCIYTELTWTYLDMFMKNFVGQEKII